MSQADRDLRRLLVVFLLPLCAACGLGALIGAKAARGQQPSENARQLERPRNLTPQESATDPGPTPKDDQLYVWPLPERGTQTVLVLRVLDGDTLEGAYLVPIMFRVKGIKAPALNDKGGRLAREDLEKLLVGKLYSANLYGREPFGRVLADFWMGKDQGWASAAMLKGGHVKPLAADESKPRE